MLAAAPLQLNLNARTAPVLPPVNMPKMTTQTSVVTESHRKAAGFLNNYSFAQVIMQGAAYDSIIAQARHHFFDCKGASRSVIWHDLLSFSTFSYES